MSRVCLAVLHGKNLNIGHFTQSFQLHIFLTCHAYRYYRLLPLYTTFTDLDLDRGHKVSTKQNLLASIFLHTLQLIRMKFKMVLKQFKLNILILFLSEI